MADLGGLCTVARHLNISPQRNYATRQLAGRTVIGLANGPARLEFVLQQCADHCMIGAGIVI